MLCFALDKTTILDSILTDPNMQQQHETMLSFFLGKVCVLPILDITLHNFDLGIQQIVLHIFKILIEYLE